MKNKKYIIDAFNKASGTYTEYSTLQIAVCRALIKLLNPRLLHKKNIVDFACGTGTSTKMLIDSDKSGKYYAIDFADKALTIAQNSLSGLNVTFLLGDYNDQHFT